MAIIPLWFFTSSGFTSGTTKGTSGSILHWLELSTTIIPFEAAIGANFALVEPPAENNAIWMSLLSKDVSVSSSTTTSLPANFTVVPADFAEENI